MKHFPFYSPLSSSLLVLLLLLSVSFLSACHKQELPPTQQLPAAQALPAKTEKKPTLPSPEAALKQIYSALGSRIGVIEPSSAEIATLLKVDPQAISQAAVRYVDGDFGVSDVYMVKPANGEDETGVSYKSIIADALKNRKDARIREFENYDVYNSTFISENALLFERGGYLILLMLEDNESARIIIENHIPEKLELS